VARGLLCHPAVFAGRALEAMLGQALEAYQRQLVADGVPEPLLSERVEGARQLLLMLLSRALSPVTGGVSAN
jgi:hypothetical protein